MKKIPKVLHLTKRSGLATVSREFKIRNPARRRAVQISVPQTEPFSRD